MNITAQTDVALNVLLQQLTRSLTDAIEDLPDGGAQTLRLEASAQLTADSLYCTKNSKANADSPLTLN